MATSPTQLTKRLLTGRGFIVAVVERWNPYARCRQDLFGFADLVAIGNGRILMVQTTSGTNHASRRRKILESPDALLASQSGGEVWVISWRKVKGRWQSREERIFSEG